MKVVLIIFLVLSILALIPIGIDGGYSGGVLRLNIKLLGFSINVFPRFKDRATSKPKKRKKKDKKKDKGEKKSLKEKLSDLPFGKEDILPLIKMVLAALGRLKCKIDLHYLRIIYCIGGDDPYRTAVGYGYASAAMGALYPLIDKAFGCVREKDIGVRYRFYPFESEVDVWLTTSIQIWVLFYVGGALLIDFIKLKKNSSKKKNNISTERANENG